MCTRHGRYTPVDMYRNFVSTHLRWYLPQGFSFPMLLIFFGLMIQRISSLASWGIHLFPEWIYSLFSLLSRWFLSTPLIGIFELFYL